MSTLDADRELAASVTALADLARCPRRYYLRVLVGLDEHAAYDRTGPDDDEPRTDDHRQRGNLAHRLLESVDLASLGRDPAGALREAAEVEGIDLSTDPELAADLRAFLATEHMKTVAAIAAADSRRVHRELAFVLRLAPDEGRTVVNLSGQIDLLWIDDSGAAVIVDYKLARSPRGEELAETYRQQLDGYALAVRRLFGPEVPIRAGLAWLRDRGAEPQLVTVDQAALDAHERGLMGQVEQLGRLLGEHDRVHPWPRLADRSLCGSCGFVSRCWSPVAS